MVSNPQKNLSTPQLGALVSPAFLDFLFVKFRVYCLKFAFLFSLLPWDFKPSIELIHFPQLGAPVSPAFCHFWLIRHDWVSNPQKGQFTLNNSELL